MATQEVLPPLSVAFYRKLSPETGQAPLVIER